MEMESLDYKLSLELDMIYEEGITQEEEDLELFDNAQQDQQKRNLIDHLKEKYKEHKWVDFDKKFQEEVLKIQKKEQISLLEELNKLVEFNFEIEAKIEYHENISNYQDQQEKVLKAKIPEDQKKSFSDEIEKIKDFDKYDVQINFDMATLLKGVEIKYRKDMSKAYKQAIIAKKQVKHYAVLGEFKVGKSWFMSKLSGKQLRQGYTFVTEGICLIYDATTNEKESPIGNCCYIDTAGFGEAQQSYIRYHQLVKRLKDLQTPVSYSEAVTDMPTIQEVPDQKGMEQDIKKEEKRIDFNYESEQNKCIVNEVFVQRFVLEISTAIYLMVGQMTGQEETFLNFIIKEITNNQRKYSSIKKIFVIHNFQQLTTFKEVGNQILKDIIKCQNVQYKYVETVEYMQGETVKKQEMGYYLQAVTKDLNAYHLTTAKEGSEAGKLLNKFTFDLIKSFQSQDNTDVTKNLTSLPQKLSFFINNNMLNYCKIQIKDKIQNREKVEKAYDKFEKDLELTSKNIADKEIELKKKTCIARLNQSSSLITLNQLKLIEGSIDIHIKNIAITKTGKQNEVAIKNMYLPEYSIHQYEKDKCFKIFVDVSCYVLNSFSGKTIQIKEKMHNIQTPVIISTSFFIQGCRVPYNKKEINVGDRNQYKNIIGLQFGNIAYNIPIDQFLDLDQFQLEDFPPKDKKNEDVIKYHPFGIVEYILAYK